MPNKAREGTVRTVRLEDELWDAAQTKAAEQGETVSDAIRRALVAYVAKGLGS